ncbi:hypothetical protein [Halomonas sp. Alg239-R46]|uniref:hypothetical protein n=1 Tax=Halomonas sp. Alg239-R46 TaxID=2993445 RepID=UPI00248F33FB|nr:hypothetical protein [Halomonas sp. Alg239-R46]
MIEEAIVHVGMHKTGSSSIQDTLSQLPMEGVEYLALTSPNHSGFLATLLPEKPEKHHSHVRNGRSVAQVKALKESYVKLLHDALKSVKKPRVLISAEYLSQPDESISELVHLREILLSYCKRIRVIGYVRGPIGFMQSAFQQTLKGGSNLSFNLLSVYPNYQQRFGKMDKVFGKENVDLVPFVKNSLHNGDVVQDFARRIGFVLSAEQIVRTNESLSLEATALLYAFRRFGGNSPGYEGFNRDNNTFVAAFTELGQKKLAFSESAVMPLLEANQHDIEWISERLGVSILDEPSSSTEAIGSEQDLLEVAHANRMAIWELMKQVSPLTPNMQGLAQLVDQLRTMHAKSISPLQTPSYTLFSPSQLEIIATKKDPIAILATLADALNKKGRHHAAQQVRNASNRASRLVKKSQGDDKILKQLAPGDD